MRQDLFSDTLTCIRNALQINKNFIFIPYSKFNENFSQILIDEKLLSKKIILNKNHIKLIGFNSKYFKNCKRISKSSRRIYVKANQIHRIQGGWGFSILSTSLGLMTSRRARYLNIGGEFLCQFVFKNEIIG